MKIIKSLFIIAMIFCLQFIHIEAGASDCEPKLLITYATVTYRITETLPPMTPKEIIGHYIIKDGRNTKRDKLTTIKLNSGQINRTINADSGFGSVYATMDYFINNRYMGQLVEYY